MKVLFSYIILNYLIIFTNYFIKMESYAQYANWDYLNGRLDGGWDMNQVAENPLKEEFKCPICKTLPRYPYLFKCGHPI